MFREYANKNCVRKQLVSSFLCRRGSNTVLGETADQREVFGTFDCEDKPIDRITAKCSVSQPFI